jgi:multidrug efflux pump subunit AcrA (membrane-fusion protein)
MASSLTGSSLIRIRQPGNPQANETQPASSSLRYCVARKDGSRLATVSIEETGRSTDVGWAYWLALGGLAVSTRGEAAAPTPRPILSENGPAMTEQSKETIGQGNEPPRSADPAPTPQTPPDSGMAVSPEKQQATRRKKMLLGAAGAVVLAAALVIGIPWVLDALNTVSTDDAFVNGHVTFVAARVRGQVARVLVDDNNRVRRGDLLVDLDKEPYRTAVAIKKAAVETAKADLQAATATVRGIEAEARSRRWKLQHAMEDVANQIAELRARVAGV